MSAGNLSTRAGAVVVPLLVGFGLIYLCVTEQAGWGTLAVAMLLMTAIGTGLAALLEIARSEACRYVPASGRRARK